MADNSFSDFSFWQGNTLYTTYNTTSIKNYFTTGFIIFNFVITFVGSSYIKKRNLSILNRPRDEDRKVPITWMTSWLSLASAAKYIMTTRRLPGGAFGILMLIIGAFNLGHGYFVNSFINLTYVTTPSWCQFTKGAITQAANGGGLPLSTFACATTIYNAQVAVDANNCAQGVWKKVNYNSTFFCPYSDEMLGYWNCTTQAVIPLDMTRFSNVSNANQFDTTVNNILRNQSFLYQQAIPPTANSYGASTAYMAWSANATNNSTSPWSVRASIATQLTNTNNGSLVASANSYNLQCNLHVGYTNSSGLVSNADWVPPVMPSYDTLAAWAGPTFGYLMNNNPGDYKAFLEWKLNGLTMISGTGNNDLRPPTTTNEYYGCKLSGTAISPAIFGLIAVLLLIVVLLLVVPAGFAVVGLINRHMKRAPKRELDDAPTDVLSWQLAAIKQATKEPLLEEKNAKDYFFGWDANKGVCVLAHSDSFQAGFTDNPSMETQSLKHTAVNSTSPISSPSMQSV